MGVQDSGGNKNRSRPGMLQLIVLTTHPSPHSQSGDSTGGVFDNVLTGNG